MKGMVQFSDAAVQNASVLRCRAETLAEDFSPATLSIPPQWIVWLLMERAGVPGELIAQLFKTDLAALNRRLCVATALMRLTPYAAHIEVLAKQWVAPPHTEAACAVQAG
jgi:hypothetical protein